MCRTISFGVALSCFAISLTSEIAAQNPKPKIIVATDEQYALLSTYGEMVGVIQGTMPADGATPNSITLRVEFDHPKNNAKNNAGGATTQQNQMAKLQADLQNASRIANPQQRQQRMNQIQAKMNQLAAQAQNPKQAAQAMVKDFIDFDLALTDKAVVRKKEAGQEYDDKGNLKETAPVKATKNGFPATFQDLRKGDEVRVYFAKIDPNAARKATPKKDANGAVTGIPSNRPKIREIFIVKSGDGVVDRKKKK